jgi:acetyl esterase
MPLDPQFQALLANVPQGPGARYVPLAELRAYVRQASTAFPPYKVPLASVVDSSIASAAGPLPVRVYTPDGTGPFPIIVYFHGGGFALGDLDTQDMIARGLSHGAQSVLVSVAYRLAPENKFPAAIDDAWTALLWAKENAKRLNGDASRIAVAGDSAGGTISCGLAVRARDEKGPRLCAQVIFYGSGNYPSEKTASAREFATGPILTADDIDYFWDLYLVDPAKDQHHPWASPLRAKEHRNLPPAFIGTAEIDPLRDDAEAYGAKLAAAGVPVEIRRYPGMVHGFLSFLGVIDGAQRALDEATSWLKARFAQVSP